MRTNAPVDQSGFPVDPAQFDSPPKPTSSPEEKLIAKAGMSKEWKLLVDYLENRKEFYRAFLPGASKDPVSVAGALSVKKLEEIGKNWVVATSIIGEVEGFISQVETVTKSVREKLVIR